MCYIRTNKSKPIVFSLLSLFFFSADITFPTRYYRFSMCCFINDPPCFIFVNSIIYNFITVSHKKIMIAISVDAVEMRIILV